MLNVHSFHDDELKTKPLMFYSSLLCKISLLFSFAIVNKNSGNGIDVKKNTATALVEQQNILNKKA